MIKKPERSERRWVVGCAAVAVLLASFPYIWGAFLTPKGYSFLGLTHNIDDGAVYLSWMRQAADGSFFIRNLFTSAAQAGRAFNVLFLFMGGFARLTHLPLICVYHLFRVLLGMGVILAAWQFSKLFLLSSQERKLLVLLVAFSSGLGWIFGAAKSLVGPVDLWQPEAITFLSIYLNPLFCAGLILMLASMYFLVLAEHTGNYRYSVCAGTSLLLLGNIHTYDVITIGCVWAVYVIVWGVVERRLPTRLIALSSIAAVIALPSAGYQFYIYKSDPVYFARVNSPAPSSALWAYLAGYGLILLGAISGAVLSICRRFEFNLQPDVRVPQLLLLVWSVVAFTLPYLPVGQQRKLIMGTHIPLCILCAYGLTALLSRVQPKARVGVLAVLVIVSARSNVQFLADDMRMLIRGETAPRYAAYISKSELAAMRYLRSNAGRGDTLFAPPSFALFVPAFTGREVYYGHWSETPDYEDKIQEWVRITGKGADPQVNLDLLKKTGSTLYITLDSRSDFTVSYSGAELKKVFSSGPAAIFRVVYPGLE